ncbi:MAG: tetratricopeptide repeat protein [Kofleriaceae bacterium]
MVWAAAPAAAQPRAEDDSAALVDSGRRALTAGDLPRAAKALDAALALNPRRVEAYVLRAAVHAAQGQPERGVTLMRRARALAPDNADVATALGSQLMLAGQADEGAPLLEEVVARAPARYEAHALLGHYYATRERWPDAVVALEAYQRTRPAALAGDDDRHRLDLAEAYLRTGRAAVALELYRALVRAHRDWRGARLGEAWAAAAVDCRLARPLLARLADEPAARAEVLLVDGQCALALGDARDALRQARRVLEAAPTSAPALALVGEAEAARGNLAAARSALEQARALEPNRTRYLIRLARVLRLAGQPAAATTELAGVALSPSSPDYRSYWIETGEARWELGTAGGVVAPLTQATQLVPDDAELLTALGGAQLQAGDPAAAVATLERAVAARADAIARPTAERLTTALVAVAEPAIRAGDLATAERALTRADQLAGNPTVWRDLGLVRLALDNPAGAVAALASAGATPDAVTALLRGRALAGVGDLAGARAAFDRAAVAGGRAVEVAVERAGFELDTGEPDAAVAALVALPPRERGPGSAARAALVTARHAAALAALHQGQATRAVALLDEAARDATGDQAIAVRCDAALAAVATGDRARALARLKSIAKLTCPFPSPADTQAVPILTAFVDGLSPRRAATATARLTALARTARGASRALATAALRVVAMTAAEQAYRAGKVAAARQLLTTARASGASLGDDELAYDLAVLDLADGKVAAAKVVFAKVAAKVPEALIGAGVAADREGDGARALELWRQAKRAGARLGVLDDWIAAKERLYGGGPR